MFAPPIIPPVPAPTPPSNDNFASAIAITGKFGDIIGTLAAATTEVSEPNHNGAVPLHSVWYEWTFNVGSVPHDVTLNLISNIPIRMAVYTGSSLASLVLVEEGTSLVSFETLGNGAQNYKIAVDTPTDVTGQFELIWLAASQFIFPANDNFANATQLSGLSGTVNTDNTYASAEVSEPNHNGSPAFKSLWYKFVLNDSGYNYSLSFDVSTSAIAANVRIALYKGASLETLVLIDDSTTEVTTNTLGTGVEQTYYIAVDSLTVFGAIALVYEAGVAGGPPPAGEYTYAYAAWDATVCPSVAFLNPGNLMLMFSDVVAPSNPRREFLLPSRGGFSKNTFYTNWAVNFGVGGFDIDGTGGDSTEQQYINCTDFEASRFLYSAWSSDAVSIATWTGNGTAQSITGVGFQPDLVWIKNLSSGQTEVMLFDSVRGPEKQVGLRIFPEETWVGSLTSFDADGFTLGPSFITNSSGHEYIAWCWQIGTHLDIVTFTPSSGGGTVSHGLGAVPASMWMRGLSGSNHGQINWKIYHKGLTDPETKSFPFIRETLGGPNGIYLDYPQGVEVNSGHWDDTPPTSTDFSYGNGLDSAVTYVAYLWKEETNESAFDNYLGSDTSLPAISTGFQPALLFIYCAEKNRVVNVGFQPDLVWIKSGANCIFDSVRGPLLSLSPSEDTALRGSIASSLLSFDSTGFTLGDNFFPTANYVGYGSMRYTNICYASCWQIGPYLDIIQFAAVAGVNTVPHSLGSVPKFFFVACVSAAQSWLVYHAEADTGNTGENGFTWPSLEEIKTGQAWFDSTPPDSVNISILADNGSNGGWLVVGESYIVYAFAESPGEAEFGTYNGNLLSFPVESTGFPPRELIIKNTEVDDTHWMGYQPTSGNPIANTRLLTTAIGRDLVKTSTRLNLNATTFSLIDPDSTSRFINDDTRAVREDRHYTYSAWENGPVVVVPISAKYNYFLIYAAIFGNDAAYFHPQLASTLNYSGDFAVDFTANGFNITGSNTPAEQFVNAFNNDNDEFLYFIWSSSVVGVAQYTGDGVGQAIAGVGFQPDFVWIKNEDGAARLSSIFDSARGVELGFHTDESDEYNDPNSLTSFDADGFTVGDSVRVNANGETYDAFCFQIGSSFDVVTFSGTGGSGTVSHGLGVVPASIWVHAQSGAINKNWIIYHESLPTPADVAIRFVTTLGDAAVMAGTYWDNTAPTSTDFSFGDFFESGATYVAYLFAEVSGGTDFGSYSGSHSSPPSITGPGFQPVLAMIFNYTKRTVISGLANSPSMLWFQEPNWFYDNIQGVTEPIRAAAPDNLLGPADYSDHLLSFDTQGFTLGSRAANESSYYIYGWENGSYFDITVFTAVSGLNTVPHDLGVVPEFFMVLPRNGDTPNIVVYHKGIPVTTPAVVGGFLAPSSNKADPDAADWFNNTLPTSTNIYLNDTGSGGKILSGGSYVAYIWAPVTGDTAFGSYIGDEISAPSVTTGFDPKLLLIKNAYDDSTDWIINNDSGLFFGAFNTDPQQTADTNSHRTTFNVTGFKVDDFADALSVNQDPAVVLVLPPSTNGPINDNFADRILLTAPGSRSLSNVNATAEVDEPAHAGTTAVNSVWFNWICSTPGKNLTFTAPGMRIAVYTGSVLASLVEVASGTGAVQVLHTTGTTDYAIAIDSSTEVNFEFAYSDAEPPLNNNFFFREILGGTSGTINASNIGANLQQREAFQYGGNAQSTVWWEWSFTDGGTPLTVSINTAGSNFDTVLLVFTGTDVEGLLLIAQGDDTLTTSQGAVSFQTPGLGGTVTYQIAVGGYEDAQGAIALNYSVV